MSRAAYKMRNLVFTKLNLRVKFPEHAIPVLAASCLSQQGRCRVAKRSEKND
jgi:hypothetical protein